LKGFTVGQILNSLKFVSAKRVVQTQDPVLFRRHKLAVKIDEQLSLVAVAGNAATADGEQRRRRIWWFTNERGALCLSIRYGARVVELAKGKNAIEVGDFQTLTKALETVKQAVLEGELDAGIEAAVKTIKRGFGG
jgi:hypothetical protein